MGLLSKIVDIGASFDWISPLGQIIGEAAGGQRGLAADMPRELVYWCAVRVVTHASTTLENMEAGAITAVMALEAGEESE